MTALATSMRATGGMIQRCFGGIRAVGAVARPAVIGGPVRAASGTAVCRAQLSSPGATIKISKFYEAVAVSEDDETPDAFNIHLDGRAVKTPAQTKLTIPSEPLAYMIALEWDAQIGALDRSCMHLTSLANTAQDNPTDKSTPERVGELLEYLGTDTVLFREEVPEELYAMQLEKWDPIIAWFNEKHGVEVPVTTGLFIDDLPADDLARIRDYTESMHPWAFAGFEFAVTNAKSFIVADALTCGKIMPAEASEAARLEMIWQCSRFGEVEWAHPMDAADTTARLAAAAVFARQFK